MPAYSETYDLLGCSVRDGLRGVKIQEMEDQPIKQSTC